MRACPQIGPLLIATLLLALPRAAAAEVSDKVASIPSIWLWALLGALAGFAAWRWRLWLGAVLSPVLFFPTLGAVLTVTDPYVGPAIRNEQGFSYVGSAFGSAALVLIAFATGAVLRVRSRRSSR